MTEYKNLGWQNGWDRESENGVPYEYQRCCDAGHERSVHKEEWWGMDTTVGDLPFEIQKLLAEYTDWLQQNK